MVGAGLHHSCKNLNVLAGNLWSCYICVMNLDTLTISDRLSRAGASPELARELAGLWHESITEGLASKDDLENTELRLKNEIGELKNELDNRITDVRTELKDDIHALDSKMSGMKGDIRVLKWGIGLMFTTVFPSVMAILYMLVRLSFVQ